MESTTFLQTIARSGALRPNPPSVRRDRLDPLPVSESTLRSRQPQPKAHRRDFWEAPATFRGSTKPAALQTLISELTDTFACVISSDFGARGSRVQILSKCLITGIWLCFQRRIELFLLPNDALNLLICLQRIDAVTSLRSLSDVLEAVLNASRA